MKQFIGRMFKQKNLGNSWGYIAQTASQAGVFITGINFFMLAATFFATAFSPYLAERGIVIPFWIFLSLLIIPIVSVGFIMFKYAVPSFFSAFNDQFYKHGSDLKKDMDELKKGNRDILKRIGKLENKKEGL